MYILNRLITVVFVLLLSACGGSGGSDGSGSSKTSTPIGDISGLWFATETGKNHNCELNPTLKKYTLTVKQSGSSLTIIDDEGNSYSSTLSGTNFSWTGNYEEDAPDGTAGRTSLHPMSASVNASCNKLNGTANWTWTATDGSGYSCSGTTGFSATRSTAPGCGTPTSPVNTDKQAPSIPQNLGFSSTSSTIDLKWSVSSDNIAVTGYSVFRNGLYLQEGIITDSEATVMYVDSGLIPSTQYCYTALAYDAAGNKSAQSTQQCVTTKAVVSIDVQAPTVPVNLKALAVSSRQINLSWSASSDDVAVTGYNIYRNSSYIKSVNGTSASDINLTASTNYCYRVLAKDAAGNSSTQSTQACEFTKPQAVTIPAAPGNITVSNITYNSAKITWTDKSNNETGFEVGTCSGGILYNNITGSTCSSGFNVVAKVMASSYTLKNLQASMKYSYYVRAYNSAGVSPNRNIRFTTSALASKSTLKITNRLSGAGSNTVLQLRIESTKVAASRDMNELLSDYKCIYLGPKSISPGKSKPYSIDKNKAENGYYVFIGIGIADGSSCISGYFKKKMSSIDSSFNSFYTYQYIYLPRNITNGKNVEIRLGYSNGYMVARVYVNGIFNAMINIIATYTNPVTS